MEGAFDNADQDVPDVEVTLVDPDGAEVDLDRSFGDVEYDAAGFRGVAFRSVDIQETDDHVLRAEAEVDDVFVVAVGRDPNDGVAALRTGAVAAGVVGLLAGLALVLFGARRSSATVPAGPWSPGVAMQPGAFVPGGAVPQGPPVYGYQGGPPQYGLQPPQPQPQYGQQPYGQGGPSVYGQPQPQPTQPPAPQFGQQPYPQAPPAPPAPQPAPPQYPQYPQPPAGQPRIPGQPDLYGQPSFPQAPIDPAGRAQPIDWAPQGPAAPALGSYPSETPPPDADFREQLRDERSTEERPPPPPPE